MGPWRPRARSGRLSRERRARGRSFEQRSPFPRRPVGERIAQTAPRELAEHSLGVRRVREEQQRNDASQARGARESYGAGGSIEKGLCFGDHESPQEEKGRTPKGWDFGAHRFQ